MIDELLKFRDRAERLDEEFKKFRSDAQDIADDLAEELNRGHRDYKIEIMTEENEESASHYVFNFYIEKDGIRRYITNFTLDDLNASTIDGILETLADATIFYPAISIDNLKKSVFFPLHIDQSMI